MMRGTTNDADFVPIYPPGMSWDALAHPGRAKVTGRTLTWSTPNLDRTARSSGPREMRDGTVSSLEKTS